MEEIVEIKGPGHPDTITDAVVEACANTLDKYYKDKYGRILHYNVDKALFISGSADIDILKFKQKEPPTFILSGNISMPTAEVKRILIKTIKDTVKSILPDLGKINVLIMCGNTSSSLNSIAETKMNNDTSFGVGYYPLSNTENIALHIKQKLDEFISDKKYPIGADYKIMVTPIGITVSSPIYFNQIRSRDQYLYIAKAIENDLSNGGLNVVFNPDKSQGSIYITKSGSSIENGDSGQVGRGNRLNGMITPCRPMTIEAYSGKNNTTHTGKLYQKIAAEKAMQRYLETNIPCSIIIVGKIGQNINDYEEYVYEHQFVTK